jgi:hypothetical protein
MKLFGLNKAKKSTYDHELEREFRPLIKCLTVEDDTRRKQMVASVLAQDNVLFVRAVASRLLPLLTGRNAIRRKQARATLIEFGVAIIPLLTYRLLKSRSVEPRIQVTELLGEIGQQLDGMERANLYQQLDVVICAAKQREVAEAVIKAVVKLRAVEQQLTQANVCSATAK